MTKNSTKKKNPNAVALGKLGGAVRARDVDGMSSMRKKGIAVFKSRFKTIEEKKAYFRMIGLKGHESQKAKKSIYANKQTRTKPRKIGGNKTP